MCSFEEAMSNTVTPPGTTLNPPFTSHGFLERVNTNRPAAHINDPRFEFDFTFSCMLRTQRVPSLSTMIASVFDLTVTKCMTRLNRSVKSESGAKHEEQMLQQKQVRHVDERCLVDTCSGNILG